jgi:hypothetical protein
MTNDWYALDTISETGFYAVVVTAPEALVPIASGYAKTISAGLHSRFSDRIYLGVRLAQEGSGAEGEITPAEADIVTNWVEGVKRPRRSGNKPPKSAIIYVERFDRLPEELVTLLTQESGGDLNVILVGAVDVSTPPSPDSLAPFDAVRIINIPSEDGDIISTAEVQRKA